MIAWTLAAIALLPPLGLAILASGFGPAAGRLSGIQLASSLGLLIAVALSFAEDQASAIDLALALAVLTLPASLLFALFEERWL